MNDSATFIQISPPDKIKAAGILSPRTLLIVYVFEIEYNLSYTNYKRSGGILVLDKSKQKGVPLIIPIVIIITLASMYYYAAFVEKAPSEKTVTNFYHAYFTRDFDTVASNLSVFWAARLLPQYSILSPAQLLEKRAEIEADTAKLISSIEEKNKLPTDMDIEIMKDYTKTGKNSAIVVYVFKEKGKAAGMEAAVLINELGQFRIFNLSPVNDQTLAQIKAIDINTLDENFAQLIAPEK